VGKGLPSCLLGALPPCGVVVCEQGWADDDDGGACMQSLCFLCLLTTAARVARRWPKPRADADAAAGQDGGL